MNGIYACPICSNPDAATWRERYDHYCSKPGEVWCCVWCGEPHEQTADMPRILGGWCAGCEEKHKAANPDCEWFRGWIPIEDTLPGGRHDGVWENSGFTLSPVKPDRCEYKARAERAERIVERVRALGEEWAKEPNPNVNPDFNYVCSNRSCHPDKYPRERSYYRLSTEAEKGVLDGSHPGCPRCGSPLHKR